jgi:hypothetical protein
VAASTASTSSTSAAAARAGDRHAPARRVQLLLGPRQQGRPGAGGAGLGQRELPAAAGAPAADGSSASSTRSGRSSAGGHNTRRGHQPHAL